MTTPAIRTKTRFIGELAFAVVVLAVLLDYLRPGRNLGEPWQVAAIFILGAIYTILGVLGPKDLKGCARPHRAAYFIVECSAVTAMIIICPQKGFFAIAAMPILSIAVMELPWRWSTLVALELWVVTTGTVGLSYGWQAALQSFPSYATPFVFTIVFSIVTRQAVNAREQAIQLSDQLAAANEQLRQHAEQADEVATTRERNRLAREIHDGLGHYLTTINVQVEAAKAVLATQPSQALTALENAARLSREALDDVRRSVGALRTDVASPPLAEALRALAQNVQGKVELRLLGSPRTLPSSVERALYRSAQEALTNVCKHAAARNTEVTVDFSDAACVRLTVADDGRGAPNDANSAGYGLIGLRERIQLLGGTVTCGNRAEGGFALHIEVPA